MLILIWVSKFCFSLNHMPNKFIFVIVWLLRRSYSIETKFPILVSFYISNCIGGIFFITNNWLFTLCSFSTNETRISSFTLKLVDVCWLVIVESVRISLPSWESHIKSWYFLIKLFLWGEYIVLFLLSGFSLNGGKEYFIRIHAVF